MALESLGISLEGTGKRSRRSPAMARPARGHIPFAP